MAFCGCWYFNLVIKCRHVRHGANNRDASLQIRTTKCSQRMGLAVLFSCLINMQLWLTCSRRKRQSVDNGRKYQAASYGRSFVRATEQFVYDLPHFTQSGFPCNAHPVNLCGKTSCLRCMRALPGLGRQLYFSTIKNFVHTNPSRKRSLPETLFKP